MTLDKFLKSSVRNAHVTFPGFDVLYVRRNVFGYFDIASVAASHPGHGAFTRLLDYLKRRWPGPIHVENVTPTRFADHLLKIGFVPHRYEGCYILWRGDEDTV